MHFKTINITKILLKTLQLFVRRYINAINRIILWHEVYTRQILDMTVDIINFYNFDVSLNKQTSRIMGSTFIFIYSKGKIIFTLNLLKARKLVYRSNFFNVWKMYFNAAVTLIIGIKNKINILIKKTLWLSC